MKLKMLKDYCGFVGNDDLVIDKGVVFDADNEVSSYLILNGYAEEVVKPKAKAKVKKAVK